MTSLKGRTVLVTGADGFIGSHLVERLVTEGAQVRAMCLYNSQGTFGWLDDASPEIRQSISVHLGDIRDSEWVANVADGVDTIFHLAALIAIPYSYQAPRSFLDTNVLGTYNVLEAARRHRVRRVVHTSTSEVYGTPDSVPIREGHPLKAQSPYAASKVAADQLALSYFRSFDVAVSVLRPFNTYGPRQSTRAVLPSILVQMLAGKSEIAVGRLDPRRDLTFVGDTVDGFVKMAEASGVEGETIQLGTGTDVSIAELFEAARRALGVDAKPLVDPRRLRPDPSEVLVLQSDPALALARLGWKPQTSLEQGLIRTAAWLRDNLSKYKPDVLHA